MKRADIDGATTSASMIDATTISAIAPRRLFHPALIAVLFAWLSACTVNDLSLQDHSLLVTAGDFTRLGLSIPENHASYESGERFSFFDGTARLDYEFEIPDDSDVESDILYLTTELYFENSVRAARSQDFFDGQLMRTLMKGMGVSLIEKKDLYTAGDESRLFELRNEAGISAGNYFYTRMGSTAFMVMFVGAYIDDPEIWDLLLGDRLDRIRRTRVKKFQLQYPPLPAPESNQSE